MKLRTLLIALALLGVAACGGNQVGSSGLFDYTPKPPGNFGFEHSPSPAAAAALGSQGAAPTSQPKQSTAPVKQPPFNIAIFGDNAATPGFYPSQANVRLGVVIVFTNKDSQPRSVVSDSGDPSSFSSPMIPPGGTWKWTASKAGTFSYHDGTRPYTLGSFHVVAG